MSQQQRYSLLSSDKNELCFTRRLFICLSVCQPVSNFT